MDITAKKELGQNFLKDKNVIRNLVETADLKKGEVVLEVGPGKGDVTEKLLDTGCEVLAVEFDRDLIPFLENKFSKNSNFKLIEGDILKLDFKKLTSEREYKIVSSLPFQITSPFLHKIVLETVPENTPESVTLIIQKEVAEKVTAEAPNSSYLHNLVRIYGNPEIVREVPKEVFDPIPKVDAAILKIEKDLQKLDNVKKFKGFLRRGFSSPRKMLNKVFEEKTLEKAGIAPTLRPEALSFDQWTKLYKKSKTPHQS